MPDQNTPFQAREVLRLQALVERRAAAGLPVYPLVLGESDLPAPAHIVEAGMTALAGGATHYAPARGVPELLDAIAAKLERVNGLAVDPRREVFVTNGSAMGVLLALQAVVLLGDEVIVSDPTYGPFIDTIRLAGGEPRFAPLRAVDGQLRWDADALAAACTTRTRAILINTPSAPSGAVMGEEELRAIGELAAARGLTIIADEVFEALTYAPHRHLSIAALDPAFAARTVSVFSFSKSYRMTGFRLGYNVAPAELIERMELLSMATGRLVAPFVQAAGVAALSGPQGCIDEQREIYASRLAAVEVELAGIPDLCWIKPEGAFYVYLDFRAFGGASRALAERLLEESGVVLTPGTFYGPAGEGWLRLSFAGALQNTLDGLAAMRRSLAGWRSDAENRASPEAPGPNRALL
jgi:aspartate/methionine/tyrosine aminotransferase